MLFPHKTNIYYGEFFLALWNGKLFKDFANYLPKQKLLNFKGCFPCFPWVSFLGLLRKNTHACLIAWKLFANILVEDSACWKWNKALLRPRQLGWPYQLSLCGSTKKSSEGRKFTSSNIDWYLAIDTDDLWRSLNDFLITSDPDPDVVRILGCFSFAECPARFLFSVCDSCDDFTESVGERSGGECEGDVGVGVASRGVETSFDTGFKFSSDFRLSLLVVSGLCLLVVVGLSLTNKKVNINWPLEHHTT